jgi:hypothetical protein
LGIVSFLSVCQFAYCADGGGEGEEQCVEMRQEIDAQPSLSRDPV